MKRTYPALLMLAVTAFLIGMTLFLFIENRNANNDRVVDILPSNVATTTTTTTPENFQANKEPSVIVEELTNDKGELLEVKRLGNGVTEEVRKEVAVRRWTHTSGATATLYSKNEFYFKDDIYSPRRQIILRLTRSDRSEFELFSNSPTSVISEKTISEVDFSPRGGYLTIVVGHYESAEYITFDASNGVELSPKDNYEDSYNQPYWNNDESKLVVLRSASPIDGGVAQIMYSPTGKFSDLKVITKAGEQYQENFFESVKVDSNTLVAVTFSNKWGSSKRGILTFDMNTGTYNAVPEIVW